MSPRGPRPRLEIEFAVGIINYAAVEPEIGSSRTGEGGNDVLGGAILGMVTGESQFLTPRA